MNTAAVQVQHVEKKRAVVLDNDKMDSAIIMQNRFADILLEKVKV